MSRFPKSKAKWFEAGVNRYVSQITRKIRSKDEVLECGATFQLVHSEFRRKAFNEKKILGKCFQLLKKLEQKQVRWDFVFEVSMKQKGRLKQIRDLLPDANRDLELTLKGRSRRPSQDLVERLDAMGIRTGHLCRWLDEEFSIRDRTRNSELHQAFERYAKAKRKLASTCLMLVIKIAHQFRDTGSTLMELIQDGNIGVMIAAEKFDPSLGWTFSAYASHWIRRCIFLGLGQRGLIKIPDGKMAEVNRCLTRIAEVSQQLGRQVSFEERHEVLSECKLSEPVLKTCCYQAVSLAQFHNPDEAGSPYLVASSSQTDCPMKLLLQNELSSAVAEVVQQFAVRERTILEMRFGLNGEDEHSLTSIAKRTGLTHQRIHQIIGSLKSQLRIQLAAYA